MTNRPVNVFVAESGNDFMADIAGWLAEAAELAGHPSRLVRDGSFPTDAAAINLVVAPHEFYVLSDADDAAIDAAVRCSTPVCTEQPGTSWFDMTVLLSRASPMVLDINTHGVAALQAEGIDAQHLRLGGVPSMERRSAGAGRPTDVLFLGGLTDYRAATLATLAAQLWERRADLRLFDFSRPVDGAIESLVFGAAKYDLLASARLLVNIHRDGGDGGEAGANHYFEWARHGRGDGERLRCRHRAGNRFCPAAVGQALHRDDRSWRRRSPSCSTTPIGAPRSVRPDRLRCSNEHPLVDSLGPILAAVPGCKPAAEWRLATGRDQTSIGAVVSRASCAGLNRFRCCPPFRPTTASAPTRVRGAP